MGAIRLVWATPWVMNWRICGDTAFVIEEQHTPSAGRVPYATRVGHLSVITAGRSATPCHHPPVAPCWPGNARYRARKPSKPRSKGPQAVPSDCTEAVSLRLL